MGGLFPGLTFSYLGVVVVPTTFDFTLPPAHTRAFSTCTHLPYSILSTASFTTYTTVLPDFLPPAFLPPYHTQALGLVHNTTYTTIAPFIPVWPPLTGVHRWHRRVLSFKASFKQAGMACVYGVNMGVFNNMV